MVGQFDGSRLELTEAHRFPNVPVRLGGTLHWDVLRLYGDMLTGIQSALAQGDVATVGVDAWGVDFGLLDARGRLLGNPVHYRDGRTDGILEHVPRAAIYAATGIQFMPINTLCQLLAMVHSGDPDLRHADQLLLMPDLFHHFLCGSTVGEYTSATTTQCFDVVRGTWAAELLSSLDIPTHVLPEVVLPGTLLGGLRPDVLAELGAGADTLRVIAPATHDTASAVAATPLPGDGSTAFLSSGTWSLVGLELDRPILSVAAREGNLTNEGGVAGTIRLLKNVMGLWLVQQARRAVDHRGASLSYEQLGGLAQAAPAFSAFVDPDDERFLRPGDLVATVNAVCAETSQPPPNDPGSLVRMLLESLALKYAVVLRQLEAVSGRPVRAIHVVGGGSNNALLCQFTADASGLPVLAGPSEAAALGNLIVQAIAVGELASVAEARALVAASFPSRRYEPAGDWSAARERFARVIRRRNDEGSRVPPAHTRDPSLRSG
jgi:rhamnulokinase